MGGLPELGRPDEAAAVEVSVDEAAETLQRRAGMSQEGGLGQTVSDAKSGLTANNGGKAHRCLRLKPRLCIPFVRHCLSDSTSYKRGECEHMVLALPYCVPPSQQGGNLKEAMGEEALAAVGKALILQPWHQLQPSSSKSPLRLAFKSMNWVLM